MNTLIFDIRKVINKDNYKTLASNIRKAQTIHDLLLAIEVIHFSEETMRDRKTFKTAFRSLKKVMKRTDKDIVRLQVIQDFINDVEAEAKKHNIKL